MTIFRLVAICLLAMCLSMTITAQTEPISPENPIITTENADQVQQLAMLGRGFIYDIAHSPDGSLLAVASSVGVWLYDTDDLQAEPRFLEGMLYGVVSVGFSPDNRYLVFGGVYQPAQIWDLETDTLVHTLNGHTDIVRDVTFSPNGQRVFSASYDNTLRVWNANTGVEISTLPHPDAVKSVSYSPDGRFIASGSLDCKVRVWDTETWQLVQIFYGHSDSVNSVAYSPDGRFIASAGQDRRIGIWYAENGATIYVLKGHQARVTEVVYSPDGQSIASFGGDVRIWDAQTGELIRQFEGHEEYIGNLSYHPDGQSLVFATDGKIQIFDTQTWQVTQTINPNPNDGLSTYQFSPFSRELEFPIQQHNYALMGVAYSPDGHLGIAGWGNGRLTIWDFQTDSLIKSLIVDMTEIAYSPQGNQVATIDDGDGIISLWQAGYTSESQIFTGHLDDDNTIKPPIFFLKPQGGILGDYGDYTKRPYSMTYSSDGKFIAVGFGKADGFYPYSPTTNGDNEIRIWDVQTKELIHILRGHTHIVAGISYSPDGRLLATGSFDNTIRIWDAITGESLYVLEGHKDRIYHVMFSPDGRFIASWSDDGTIRIWGIPVVDD